MVACFLCVGGVFEWGGSGLGCGCVVGLVRSWQFIDRSASWSAILATAAAGVDIAAGCLFGTLRVIGGI